MKPYAYYNENDSDKAAWLRELIRRNVVADGEVDERSVKEVEVRDLAGFAQCHFFAGIGVWSYALRLAGWPDDRSVWTGSCPCPSFSAAGKGEGFDDPRHLWPDWARLIRLGKPATVFGEQADDAIGYGWLDLVQTDLERENYAVGKAVLGACSIGAPHIRQRLYFVAQSLHAERRPVNERGEDGRDWQDGGRTEAHGEPRACGEVRELEFSDGDRRKAREPAGARNGHGSAALAASATGKLEHAKCNGRKQSAEMLCEGQPIVSSGSETVGLGNASGTRFQERERDGQIQRETLFAPEGQATERGGYVNGFWRDADWILRKRWNRDDWEWCPTEPGAFPLVAGATARVLRLRGYGDAICAPLAAEFIRAYEEVISCKA